MTPGPTRTIGFILSPGFVLLDLSGALEVFNLANRLQPNRYRLRVMSSEAAW